MPPHGWRYRASRGRRSHPHSANASAAGDTRPIPKLAPPVAIKFSGIASLQFEEPCRRRLEHIKHLRRALAEVVAQLATESTSSRDAKALESAHKKIHSTVDEGLAGTERKAVQQNGIAMGSEELL